MVDYPGFISQIAFHSNWQLYLLFPGVFRS